MRDDPTEDFDLGAFAGRWLLWRDITDHLGGERGQFRGEAVFSPESSGLRYIETGLLGMGGRAPLKATRQYLWQQAGQGIEIRFADGRPFYSFRPGRALVSARHFCQPDDYRVTHDFRDWPEWRSDWRVEGPRKHYEMQAVYRREAG